MQQSNSIQKYSRAMVGVSKKEEQGWLAGERIIQLNLGPIISSLQALVCKTRDP
jgi:hypothetical protein